MLQTLRYVFLPTGLFRSVPEKPATEIND